MPSQELIVFEGAMGTSETEVQRGASTYTPDSDRALIVQGVLIFNGDNEERWGRVLIGETTLSGEIPIDEQETLRISGLEIPLLPGETISVQGEVSTAIRYRIWGLEVST